MKKEPFNKKKYDIEYKKIHKARFVVDLNKEEMILLENLLKDTNKTKADFLRESINEYYIKIEKQKT